MKYSSIQNYAYALYLIFPNGLSFHDEWVNTPAMYKLRWCRSFTTRLIWNIFDICKSACDQSITFYDQKWMQAEDDVDNDKANGAKSIIILYAGKKKEVSLLLAKYLQMPTESDHLTQMTDFLVILYSP
jgi:hypothetical protein